MLIHSVHHNRSHTARRFFSCFLLCLALVLPAFVSGCAYVDDRVNFDLTGQTVVYRDQWARRDPPSVYVQPAEVADSQLTALFVPFRVTQPITDPEIIGYTQARVVWQTWLAKRLFSVMEFDANQGPFRRDRAIAAARARGADVVIGGFVTYYYAGGSEADSQVALQVEIYDTASGQLIWSMAQSALMPARMVNDYIVFSTETRAPSDPMFALARTIAEDMGNIIGRWAQPVDGPRFEVEGGPKPQPMKSSF
ncbi:putative Lipoprotein [uncultured delta proteobacterium]|uniref:Putative Lipoprotein n=1 Tax=uncultured delta proteobacterium TaxID=34034 RepID=A0A212JTE9_9DELT|nr:putative Lipoprotein [uncultured delta proteobacterium]